MKAYYLFFNVFLLLLLGSCDDRKEQFIIDQELDVLSKENQSISAPIYTGNLSGESASVEFERKMQWTSFIAAEVLRYSEEAQSELVLMNEEFGVIPLSLLFVDGGTPLLTFEEEFRAYLNSYILLIEQLGRPEHGEDIPPVQQPPNGNPINIENMNTEVEQFINYMVHENCVEFYFPEGLTFPKYFELTSTAHPLSHENGNEGYLRYYEPIIHDDGTQHYTKTVKVNPNYVSLNQNIIVARPYRGDDLSIECIYEEYASIDFTLFLTN